MVRVHTVDCEFVERLPPVMREATIYISIPYRTTGHLCMCGCGEKVIHPLRPHRWSMTYDGSTVSLRPSIGNVGLACKSHYWIERNAVRWCEPLTAEETNRALARDRWTIGLGEHAGPEQHLPAQRPWWRRLLKRVGRPLQ